MGIGLKNYKFSDIVAKAVGIGGLGFVAYDAHKYGTIEAPRNEKKMKAENIRQHYDDYMKYDGNSVVKNSIKKKIFDFYVNENITPFFNNIGGYVKGLGKGVVDNVVPLTLAAGAVISPKGFFSKMFGIGLLGYFGLYAIQHLFNIGKHKD